MGHGTFGVIVHRIVYATFTTMVVFGMVHATVFGPSIMTVKVGAVVTYWATAVPVGVRVTTFVLAVTDVVVTEIVFAALSPADHERDAGLYVTPVTAVGVSVIALASVGPALGVTVTTCAAPPLMTSTDAVTVHVPRGLIVMLTGTGGVYPSG